MRRKGLSGAMFKKFESCVRSLIFAGNVGVSDTDVAEL